MEKVLVKVVNSRYLRGLYYCSSCGRWLRADEVYPNHRGQLWCKYCGRRVRTKPEKTRYKFLFR